MWIHASCFLEFNPQVATPFLLMLRPRSGMQQWIAREQYTLIPSVPAVEFTDPFGNLCQQIGCPSPAHFRFTRRQISRLLMKPILHWVHLSLKCSNFTAETLPFLLPSRYCESDRFTEMAASLARGWAPGYDQCVAIVNYIRDTSAVLPRNRTADHQCRRSEPELTSRLPWHGSPWDRIVPRAFAIPARMVVGYLHTLWPMDMHAWFEAYVGGRWYTFDPTQDTLQGVRVAIAYGRDAADVAVYTQFGDPVELLRMDVSVEQLASPPV